MISVVSASSTDGVESSPVGVVSGIVSEIDNVCSVKKTSETPAEASVKVLYSSGEVDGVVFFLVTRCGIYP